MQKFKTATQKIRAKAHNVMHHKNANEAANPAVARKHHHGRQGATPPPSGPAVYKYDSPTTAHPPPMGSTAPPKASSARSSTSSTQGYSTPPPAASAASSQYDGMTVLDSSSGYAPTPVGPITFTASNGVTYELPSNWTPGATYTVPIDPSAAPVLIPASMNASAEGATSYSMSSAPAPRAGSGSASQYDYAPGALPSNQDYSWDQQMTYSDQSGAPANFARSHSGNQCRPDMASEYAFAHHPATSVAC